MNSLLLAAIALAALAGGYIFYSRKVREWLNVDPNLTPPSEELRDGVDYVPARHWTVLFGHHFASIAGAAPIIGPVIAGMIWGWLPAVLWLVFGGIFFGAVHDYFALMFSVEHKGRSVSDLSGSVLGKWAKIVFGIFVLLALILVVAVFAAVASKTLVETPEVVIPTFGLILVALLVGYLMYSTNVPLLFSSLLGLEMLFGLMLIGYRVPVSLPVADAGKWWTIILVAYGAVAAVLPVWLLLQPRDHLSVGVLVVGMGFGFVGIAISHPTFNSPAYIAYGGTAVGWLWPMMFVTIACGAISGFHSLVASGTTSKQLPRIKDGRAIGYGAMVMESALGVLALIAVTAGLYWKAGPGRPETLVYPVLMENKGWIGTFGAGYGRLTYAIFGSLGMMVGIIMLNTFVVTTLDTATRIARYLCTELVGDTFRIKPFKNRYVATAAVAGCSLALALGNWKAIWPIFGSANQLIAAMVLMIATVYLLRQGRRWAFAGVPAVLVLITATGALIFKLVQFATSKEPSWLLIGVTIILLALDAFIGWKSFIVIRDALRGRTRAEAPETTAG